MSVGAVLSRLQRVADAAFGPVDRPVPPPAPALAPEPPVQDTNGSPIFDRRPVRRQTTILDLIERPDDGPLVYSDKDRTPDGEPTLELILYRFSSVPILLRVDLG
jgi:hypothetical protein